MPRSLHWPWGRRARVARLLACRGYELVAFGHTGGGPGVLYRRPGDDGWLAWPSRTAHTFAALVAELESIPTCAD